MVETLCLYQDYNLTKHNMDFRFDGAENLNQAPIPVVKDVKSGTTSSISIGHLFRTDNGNAGYVKLGADGDTATLNLARTYLAVSDSTETAGADGIVKGIWCPNMRLRGTPTTPSNLTQARIDTRVTLDLSGSTQKIDENHVTDGFMRIVRPEGGADNFDTTNGYDTAVIVNESVS